MSVDNLKNKESSRVVVTDAATVTALGNNLESFWQGLIAGETAIRPITRFPVDQDHYKAKVPPGAVFFMLEKSPPKERSSYGNLQLNRTDDLRLNGSEINVLTDLVQKCITNYRSF